MRRFRIFLLVTCLLAMQCVLLVHGVVQTDSLHHDRHHCVFCFAFADMTGAAVGAASAPFLPLPHVEKAALALVLTIATAVFYFQSRAPPFFKNRTF